MPLPSEPTLYKATGESQPFPPPNGRDFTLAEVQAAVGGYVECVPLGDTGLIALMNEDGQSLQLPINDFATMEATMLGAIGGAPILGDVVICPSKMLK
jgi:hypothetical protein